MKFNAFPGIQGQLQAILTVFPGFDQVRNQPPVFIHPQQFIDDWFEPRPSDIYPARDTHSGGGNISVANAEHSAASRLSDLCIHLLFPPYFIL
jgi:hypothetical protein